eukprot:3482270-Prorocentrum_lima.AAC.1
MASWSAPKRSPDVDRRPTPFEDCDLSPEASQLPNSFAIGDGSRHSTARTAASGFAVEADPDASSSTRSSSSA